MSAQTNEVCAQCLKAYNGLNGRFCNELGCYVEWDKEPKCAKKGDLE